MHPFRKVLHVCQHSVSHKNTDLIAVEWLTLSVETTSYLAQDDVMVAVLNSPEFHVALAFIITQVSVSCSPKLQLP